MCTEFWKNQWSSTGIEDPRGKIFALDLSCRICPDVCLPIIALNIDRGRCWYQKRHR